MLNLNRDEPKCFKSFKTKNKPHRYTEDCDDSSLRDCLRQALLEEQRSQCYYCEQKIVNSSKKVHIDHIKQRTHYHKLECEYSNMALSCNSQNHCGMHKDKKGEWNDDKFIRIFSENHELREKPSEMFNFISNGEIEVKKSLSEDKKVRAKNSIKYLNLNHSDLIATRRNIFLHLETYKEDKQDIDNIFNFFNGFESIFK